MGWIHTHPSQTAFLSTVDLHTHCPYQLLMPETIANSALSKISKVGIYHLTLNHGLQYIQSCPHTGFHPHHVDSPLFDAAHHTTTDRYSHVKVVDLRRNNKQRYFMAEVYWVWNSKVEWFWLQKWLANWLNHNSVFKLECCFWLHIWLARKQHVTELRPNNMPGRQLPAST